MFFRHPKCLYLSHVVNHYPKRANVRTSRKLLGDTLTTRYTTSKRRVPGETTKYSTLTCELLLMRIGGENRSVC